jgi:type I restriction enzyme S subunit
MKSEWKSLKLSDIAYLSSDKIEMQDVGLNNYISTDNMLPDKSGVEPAIKLPSAKRVSHFEKGDILFSNIRPYFKKVWLAEFEGGASADVLVWKPLDKELVTKEYLYYLLSSDEFIEYSVRTSKGVKMPRGDKEAMLSYELILPPIEVQRNIALLGRRLDHKITNNTVMNATLEKIAQRIFKSWFVDFDPVKANAEDVPFDGLSSEIQALFPNEFEESELGMIPKGWEAKTFKDFCKSVSTGGTPKRSESSYWNGNVHWLSSGEVKKPISIETKEYITELGLQKSAAKLWPVETVVIAMYGATAGEVTILANEMTTNQACCGLIPNDNSSFYLFIAATLEKEKLASKASGAAQQNLNKGIIETHQFIMPNNSLLEQFDKTVRPLFNKWILNEQQNLGLSKIRDKLLPRLISGKITIQKAEELLEEAS